MSPAEGLHFSAIHSNYVATIITRDSTVLKTYSARLACIQAYNGVRENKMKRVQKT